MRYLISIIMLFIAASATAEPSISQRPFDADRTMRKLDPTTFEVRLDVGEAVTFGDPRVRHIREIERGVVDVDRTERGPRFVASHAGKSILRVYWSALERELSHHEREHGLRVGVITIVVHVEPGSPSKPAPRLAAGRPLGSPLAACDFGKWELFESGQMFDQHDYKTFTHTLAVGDSIVFRDEDIRKVWADDTASLAVDAVDEGHRLRAEEPGLVLVRVYSHDRPVRVPEAREHPERMVVTLVIRVVEP